MVGQWFEGSEAGVILRRLLLWEGRSKGSFLAGQCTPHPASICSFTSTDTSTIHPPSPNS